MSRVWLRYSTTGLSPRVRGNRSHNPDNGIGPWSIPACAGEPNTGWGGWALSTVYPRVCGGTIVAPRMIGTGSGLSPRVRGNPPLPDYQPFHVGSIPACAGEPNELVSVSPSSSVYPRVCGGTSANLNNVIIVIGLSPRVRGNHLLYGVIRVEARSIPACAGEPVTVTSATISPPVYPRVCGGTIGRRQPVH